MAVKYPDSIPVNRMTGVISAQKAPRNASQTSRRRGNGSDGMFFFLAIAQTIAIKASAISKTRNDAAGEQVRRSRPRPIRRR